MNFLIEMKCPIHGYERFRIKVVRKYNIPTNAIIPKLRSRPKPGELSQIVVGRYVPEKEIKNFLIDYLRKNGLWPMVLKVQIEK